MRPRGLTAADLSASVVAVPPLARRQDLSLNVEENRKIIRYLESGGVRILLYGGNANCYHQGPEELAALLQLLESACGPDTVAIPSVGPSYGVMMEEAKVLRGTKFPTAMVLPEHFASTPKGFETGVRKFVEALRRPAVLYLKQEGLINVEGAARLVKEELVCAIKYAVTRLNPRDDPFLRRLTAEVDPRIILSGMGEQPAVPHLLDFGLAGFTSGLVCLAPRRSMELLEALKFKDLALAESIREAFRPAEELRNRWGAIRVLHEAVTLSGIAEAGPLLPLLSSLEEDRIPAVRDAARALLAYERAAES